MEGWRIPLAITMMALVAAPLPARAPLLAAGTHALVPAPPPSVQPAPPRVVSASDMRCLAMNVYWESRGQPLAGQAAVAHVTLNRVGVQGFASSVCAVVGQGRREGRCQFGWMCQSGRATLADDDPAWRLAEKVARQAAAGGPDPTRGAHYFHPVGERPAWVRGRYGHKVVIGRHVFFTLRHEP